MSDFEPHLFAWLGEARGVFEEARLVWGYRLDRCDLSGKHPPSVGF